MLDCWRRVAFANEVGKQVNHVITEIVILAMIAAFLGLRLDSVLGRRSEHEEEVVPHRFERSDTPAQAENAPRPARQPVVLRVVGYPGKLRLDHPVSLQVLAGRREWQLDDITLANPVLATDGRDAAAEFALDPLLDDLSNNRPLRLALPGVFTELPIPPYVVGEWRSLQELPLS